MADKDGTSNEPETPGGSGDGSQEGQDDQAPGGSKSSPGGSQQSESTRESKSARERELEREIASLRKENGSFRTKLKEHEDEKLSESEKLQKQIADLQKERDELARERQRHQVERAVTEEARRAGARRPEAIYRLVDIETDADGKPLNIESQIKAAKEQYPELFGTSGSADGGAGKQSPPAGNMNDAIRRAAGRS